MKNINFNDKIINLCSEYDNYILKGCGYKNKELEVYKDKIRTILDANKYINYDLVKEYNVITKNKLFKDMLNELEKTAHSNKHDKKRIKSLKDGTTLKFYVNTIKTLGVDKDFDDLMIKIGNKFIFKKS